MLALLTVAAIGLLVLILAAFICGVLIGRAGRDALRLELASLKGRHETLSEAYSHLRELAGKAVELAREKHFPEAKRANPYGDLNSEIPNAYYDSVARSMPNIKLPEEKWCPQCNVSVRSETWPQECPACSSVFGFDEQ